MMVRRILLAGVCWMATAFGVTCVATTTGVAFGTYPLFSSTPTDSTATVTVSCVTATPTAESYTVSLSTGGSSSYNRRLSSGLNTLNYNLYTDSTRLFVWGNGTSGTSVGFVLRHASHRDYSDEFYGLWTDPRAAGRHYGNVWGCDNGDRQLLSCVEPHFWRWSGTPPARHADSLTLNSWFKGARLRSGFRNV